MLGGSISGGRTNVRVVVVVGDRATCKSSLITAAATETFPEEVPPVLPPTRLPADLYPDNVPVTIIDTSSSLESRGKVAEELKRADAVVLTYACDQPSTLNRLTTFWLYEFRRLERSIDGIPSSDLTSSNRTETLERTNKGFKGSVLSIVLALSVTTIAAKYALGDVSSVLTPKDLMLGTIGFLLSKVSVFLAAFQPITGLRENK